MDLQTDVKTVSPISKARRSRRLEAKNVMLDVTGRISLKNVEIKLRKIKIDPNLIFGVLENRVVKDRVESVVGKESSPVTRQR